MSYHMQDTHHSPNSAKSLSTLFPMLIALTLFLFGDPLVATAGKKQTITNTNDSLSLEAFSSSSERLLNKLAAKGFASRSTKLQIAPTGVSSSKDSISLGVECSSVLSLECASSGMGWGVAAALIAVVALIPVTALVAIIGNIVMLAINGESKFAWGVFGVVVGGIGGLVTMMFVRGQSSTIYLLIAAVIISLGATNMIIGGLLESKAGQLSQTSQSLALPILGYRTSI